MKRKIKCVIKYFVLFSSLIIVTLNYFYYQLDVTSPPQSDHSESVVYKRKQNISEATYFLTVGDEFQMDSLQEIQVFHQNPLVTMVDEKSLRIESAGTLIVGDVTLNIREEAIETVKSWAETVTYLNELEEIHPAIHGWSYVAPKDVNYQFAIKADSDAQQLIILGWMLGAEPIAMFKDLLNFIQPSFEKVLFEQIDFEAADVELAQKYHFPQLRAKMHYYYGLTHLSLIWA